MEKIFRKFVKFIIGYYWLVLLAGIGLAGISFPKVIYLFKHISTDFADLLPRDFPSVQSLFKVRDKVHPRRRIPILLESDNTVATRANLEDLKNYLQKDPLVGKVYAKKEDFDFFKKHQLFYLTVPELVEIRDKIDRKIQRKKLGDFYISFEDDAEFDLDELKEKYLKSRGIEGDDVYYVSPDGRIYGMMVESREPNLNLAQEKKFQEELYSLVAAYRPLVPDPTLKIQAGSSIRALEYKALIRDLKIAGAISGVLIFLPLLIRFRRPLYVLGIFLPLALGVPVGLALASFWIEKLNVTTSFLFAILGGLGVETGIHLFSRYTENRTSGKNIEDSLLDLYVSLGPPVLTAVSALAVTFLLMIFGKFRGFSEFGLISGIGLYVLFLMYFTVFPAILVLMEKLKIFRWNSHPTETEWKLRFSPDFVRTVLGLFTLLTLLSLFTIPKLRFEYDTHKIRIDSQQEKSVAQKQKSLGFPSLAPAVIFIENEQQSDALDEAITKKKNESENSVVNMTRSIYSLVPKEQDKKMEVIHEMIGLLSDDSIELVKGKSREDLETFKDVLKKHHPFNLADVPSEIQNHFLGDDKKDSESFFMIYKKPNIETDDGRNAIRFAEEVQEIQTPLGKFQATNDAIIFADVLRTLFKDSRKILLISILSISLFVFIDFRSLKKTALIVYSILAGLIWVLGIMFLLGIKFNLYNMVMIPAIIGMSIDNSIHIYHRYEELGKGSLGKVLGTTGVSALLASTTNAAGFIGLVFCTHGGLRSMGVIVLLGLGTCLVTTLVYLPMILEYWENHKKVPKNLVAGAPVEASR